MLELLKKCGYVPPQLKEWKKENVEVFLVDKNAYHLTVDGQRWMVYDSVNHLQASEFFSHYHLAKGHCICSGLGFGVRENWLLTKKNVSKITVLEKNKEVIEYHQHIKSPFLDNIEVIHCDASEYTGKCDTLLLDHYELESWEDIIKNVKKISNNVKCDALWFWPLEKIITDYYKDNNSNFFSNNQSYSQIYKEIKTKNELSKLPDLDEKTLKSFCFAFSCKG